jgi:hypothetical protein
MAFELYEKQRASGDEETVNISAVGVISFSPALVEQHLKGTTFVELYYDASTRRIGVKPVKTKTKYSYQLIKQGKRLAVSGSGFLNNYKIIEKADGKFKAQSDIDVKFQDGILVFRAH